MLTSTALHSTASASASASGAGAAGLSGQIAYTYSPRDLDRPAEVGDSRIVATPAAGGKESTIAAKDGYLLVGAEYSPDGTKIAWVAGAYGDEGDGDGVYVALRDGSGAKLIAKTSWTDSLTWTPDGRSIVFVDVSEGIFTVPADGSGAAKQVLASPADGSFYREPTVSPDGALIVFEHIKESSNVGVPHTVRDELWKVRADGTGVSQFLPRKGGPLTAQEPEISPDGQHVVFDGRVKKGDRASVFIAPIDGSSFRKVWTAPRSAWIGGPTWSPDGTHVALASGYSLARGSKMLILDPASSRVSTLRSVKTGELSSPSWAPPTNDAP